MIKLYTNCVHIEKKGIQDPDICMEQSYHQYNASYVGLHHCFLLELKLESGAKVTHQFLTGSSNEKRCMIITAFGMNRE